MRPFLPLLAALLALSAVADAGPPRKKAAPPPPPPEPPAAEADTASGLAVLHAPGPEQILIRGGTFTMGSSDAEFAEALGLCRAEPRREDCKEEQFACEQSAHEVYLDDYWIDRTEVTVAR